MSLADSFPSSTGIIHNSCPENQVSESDIDRKKNSANIACLSADVLLRIFSFLDARTLTGKISLVDHVWKHLSFNRVLWSVVLKKENLFHRQREAALTMGWKYRNLSLHFCTLNHFEIAILICNKSALYSHTIAAYGFLEICQEACKVKNYEIALKCQELAKKHDPMAGNIAMGYYKQSQAK